MKAQINVEFNETPNRQELQSGEEIKSLFGKIKKQLTDLKPVAFSGSYNDLTDTPDIEGTLGDIQAVLETVVEVR